VKILLLALRYRLLLNILALALALGIWAVTPVVAGFGWLCSTDCVDWDAQNGCTRQMECCSNTDGRWYCHYV
jgi:hypothetical protein